MLKANLQNVDQGFFERNFKRIYATQQIFGWP